MDNGLVGILTGETLDDQIAWGRETFGGGPRVGGVLEHIRKELVEIEESDIDDWSEFIDVMILAIDGMGRRGATGQQIIEAYHAKMKKNRGRVWPDWRQFSEDEAIEHDRSYD